VVYVRDDAASNRDALQCNCWGTLCETRILVCFHSCLGGAAADPYRKRRLAQREAPTEAVGTTRKKGLHRELLQAVVALPDGRWRPGRWPSRHAAGVV